MFHSCLGSFCPCLNEDVEYRQAVADVEDLKKKIDQLQTRSNALETALRTIQAAVSDEPHPLLCENAGVSVVAHCGSGSDCSSICGQSPQADASVPHLTAEEEDALDAFGVLLQAEIHTIQSFTSGRYIDPWSAGRNTILRTDFTFRSTSFLVRD